ncbi:MAG TPA: ABC transporter ATP-binding protein [Thermoanaerobaculia bacterium]|jgi:ABC-2 type transport system ATP-binding protein
MITTRRLTKRYGAKAAVRELDLEIPRGQFFCFLGPNGAGKTTTIKMLTGLARPTSGTVAIGGHDMAGEPLAAKRLLGFVPDHPFLYDRLTGRELMRFVAGIYRMTEDDLAARCEPLLAAFDVLHAADQLIQDYSHGMRQKLSFASCFLHDPQVVVVDEPWVGLDPKSIHKVKTYLKERTREGLTVFMSTHSLAIAEETADRVGIIHEGRLRHLGTVAEIKALARRPGSLEEVFLELTREAEEALVDA